MKKFRSLLLVVFISVLMVGCTMKKNDTIKFSTWGSKSEIDIITPVVEKYNETHSVKVELVHIPQNYFQKLHLLFASNLSPDVIFINNLYLKIYQKAGLLEDLSDLVDTDDYFKNAISTLSIDGKLYAVPRDVSNMVIFYNRDILKKHSINPSVNWNLEEFYNISAKVRDNNTYGFCTEFDSVYWENFVSAESKPIILNNEITIKNDKSLASLQRLSDSINKEKTGANKEQLALMPCAQLFLQNKSAFFVSGRWSVPKLDSQKGLNYGILPFPKSKSDYYIPLNASGWAISKKSKNKDAAKDFIKYLNSDENLQKLTSTGLIVPAKKSIANSNFFENGKIFIDVIDKSTPNIVTSDYNILIDKINQAATSVLSGYSSAKEAFSSIHF